MLSLTRLGPEAFDGRQIAVYPDGATAAEVMAGFRCVLAACAQKSPDDTYITTPLHLADEGLVVAEGLYQSGMQVPEGGYDVLVRDGRSIYLASIGREFQPKGTAAAAAARLVAAARSQLPLPQ